ncbi:alpha/beta hydrolase [Kineococcus sp. NPDC059986]|uniref:alpha/beta fold hydrolase n=1 Tax=Kineococcus sp. NPDC059986 TaxID=3155538 RepID=UPI00344DFD6D
MTTLEVQTDQGDTVVLDRYGSGPAVVFIAGAGPYREIDGATTQTAQALADRGFTTTVHDRVGRGDSAATGDVTLERELAAVAAVVDAAGGGPAVLVGHSSGCSIALAAAARGVPTAGLVLWEAPLDEQSDLDSVRSWLADVTDRLDAGDLAGATAEYVRDMPAEFREGLAHMPFHARFVAQAPAYRADGESLVWAASGPLGELLGRDVPVLALVGEQTFPGMPEAAARIAREVPGAVSEVLAGAWHSWDVPAAVDRFAAFARAVQPTRV